jgi:hypothetical protein
VAVLHPLPRLARGLSLRQQLAEGAQLRDLRAEGGHLLTEGAQLRDLSLGSSCRAASSSALCDASAALCEASAALNCAKRVSSRVAVGAFEEATESWGCCILGTSTRSPTQAENSVIKIV